MKKVLLTSLLSFIMVAMTFAQTDSIMLADYETGSLYSKRTHGWNDNLGLTLNVDNPKDSGVNTSSKVIRLHLTTQYSQAVDIDSFDAPISLAVHPYVRVKVLSDSAVKKGITIVVTDINGYSQSISSTLPKSINTSWADITADFTDAVKNTPISLIKLVEIQIDYANETTTSNQHNIYYLDDIRFTGDTVKVTSSTVLTLASETFSTNGWWMSKTDPNGAYYSENTLGGFRTAAWGGSALSVSSDHYNSSDSLRMVMTNWSSAQAELFPLSTRPGLSKLEMINFSIAGKNNLKFLYDLEWVKEPSSYTDSPTIEYQLDGGSWTTLSTSSTLPSASGTWATGLEYPLTGISGKNLNLRITNNTIDTCYIDNLTLTGTEVFADSVHVTGTANVSEILTLGDSLQMLDTIFPSNATQDVWWSVENGTGQATISTSGLLTAVGNGTVTVAGRALDLWGTKIGKKVIRIGPIVKVTSITVSGADITTAGGTSTFTATIEPTDATEQGVTWTVSDNLIATIDAAGVLTAKVNGTVNVIATTKESGSAINGTKAVTISGQATDVSEVAKENFSIYPNPATSVLYVVAETQIKTINIVNVTGQTVKVISNKDVTTEINVSDLLNGYYLIRVETANGAVITKSFVKQ
jgi:hypothetical protein